MKKKIPRIVAILLALVLAAGCVTPASAAVETYITVDGKAYNAGNLIYDYDQIPVKMKYNFVLNALQYIGYDVQALKEQKLLFHPDYLGPHIENLPGWEDIVSHIPYQAGSGVAGHTTRPALAGEKTKTGNVPDLDALKVSGLVCTSFLEYLYFGYARNVEGPDVEQLLYCYQKAVSNVGSSAEYPDLWTDTMEGTGGAVDQGAVRKFTSTLDDSIEQTDAFRKILERIRPGTLVRFGKEGNPYVHWAVYIGTYNNQHYVAHQSSDRGPEISSIETIANYESTEKRSYPLAFYDLGVGEDRGNIQVIKTDSADGTPLAGAWFEAISQSTLKHYTFGPTSDTGVAIISELPLGTYSVREITAPDGYTMSSEVKIVTLTEEDPVPEPLIFTNTKADAAGDPVGSLQINKNTSTGTDKAGWQFELFNNRFWHTGAVNSSTSGQMFRVTVLDRYGNSVTSKPATQTYAPITETNDADYIQITQQLPDYTRINSGGGLSLVVHATGTDLSYRWQYSDDGGASWTNYSASYNTNRFVATSTSSAVINRMIRLQITDAEGHKVFSTPTTVVLKSTLLITDQPADASALFESSASFIVTALSSQALSYQWQFSTDGGVTWTNCNGANHSNGSSGFTDAALTVSSYDTLRNKTLYRCAVSDTNETVYSEPAALQVLATEITSQPQSYTGSFGDSVTFTVGHTGTELNWVWEYSTDGGVTWIVAQTGSSSLTVDLSKETHGRLYRAAASRSDHPGIVTYSDAALLLEKNSLYIVEQPKDVNAVVEGDAIFYVNATGEGLCYIWQTSTDGGKTWTTAITSLGTYTSGENGTVQIDGLTSGSYFVQEINDGKEGWTYDLASKAVTVAAENTATNPAIVTFYNEKENSQAVTGTVTVNKNTTNGGSKQGWMIYLLKNGSPYKAGQTDSTGTLIFTDVKPGVYTVMEMGRTDGSESYWIMDEESQKTITVTAGGDTAVSFANQYIGKGTVTKVYEDGSSPVGTQFKVSNRLSIELGTYTVDESHVQEDGSAVIELGQLQPGTYYIEEILPDGSLYRPIGGSVKLLTVTAGQTANVLFTGELIPGSLTVTKVNTDGDVLAGATFLLEWSEDGSIWTPVSQADGVAFGGCGSAGLTNGTLTTDETGIITFENLHPGLKYRLTETLAPDGYARAALAVFEDYLTSDNFAVAIEVENSRIFSLPDTGISDLFLAGGALTNPLVLAVGSGLLLMLTIIFFPRFHRGKDRGKE